MSGKVRVIKSKNLALIKEMDAKCFPDEPLEDAHEHTWFVAFVDGKPAGYAAFKVWAGDIVFLSRAGVLEEHRGHGIQKKLIKAREKHALRLGAKWAVTYTWMYGVYSPNSLISCGYKLFRPQNQWAGSDWLYWRKKLT